MLTLFLISFKTKFKSHILMQFMFNLFCIRHTSKHWGWGKNVLRRLLHLSIAACNPRGDDWLKHFIRDSCRCDICPGNILSSDFFILSQKKSYGKCPWRKCLSYSLDSVSKFKLANKDVSLQKIFTKFKLEQLKLGSGESQIILETLIILLNLFTSLPLIICNKFCATIKIIILKPYMHFPGRKIIKLQPWTRKT